MQDFIGKTFDQWSVLSYEGKKGTERHWYKVRCNCGNTSTVERNILKRGKSTRCRSCARKLSTSGERNASFRHGYSSPNHPQYYLHYIWCSIKQRCLNPKDKGFKRYGGRGITICDSWKNNFEQFVRDMGERPEGYSIDRIDNDKGYCKENCRWAIKEIQANNCRTNTFYVHKGEKLSETQWSRKLGISRNKLMWWARKYGIEWVIDNLEMIKKMKRGMDDQSYSETNFENKRRFSHGALIKNSPLLPTHHVYRGYKERYAKLNLWTWSDFNLFLKDMGEKQDGKRLKRKDKTLPFSKENCYWG